MMIAPEHSGVQRAEQQAAPGPAQLLSSELVVFSASFVLSAAAFDYVTQQLRDIVIALLRAGSDEFVTTALRTPSWLAWRLRSFGSGVSRISGGG